MKSGNFNFLEPTGPLQACNGTALLLPVCGTTVFNEPIVRARMVHEISKGDSEMLIGRLCMKIPFGVAIILPINIDIYTGCPRRKGPNFGRVFLRSNYTDITQNTYIQSSMVTEILAREV